MFKVVFEKRMYDSLIHRLNLSDRLFLFRSAFQQGMRIEDTAFRTIVRMHWNSPFFSDSSPGGAELVKTVNTTHEEILSSTAGTYSLFRVSDSSPVQRCSGVGLCTHMNDFLVCRFEFWG